MKNFINILLMTFSLAAFAGEHYSASNCELFIDKIEISEGSHGSRIIKPYIKILPQKLDSAVVEVGVRQQATSKSKSSTSRTNWQDVKLESSSPVGDYYVVSGGGFTVSSDFGTSTLEAVFYVRTRKGTTYWAKNDQQKNFVFNGNAWRNLSDISGLGYNSRLTIATQRADMKYYNLNACY